MPTYIGFSTQNGCKPKSTNLLSGSAGGPGGIRSEVIVAKKYTLVDSDLVLQDLINSLNIRQGTKVGQPGYGTRLWDYVFEYNTAGTQFQIENEIKRLASQDPRMFLNTVKAYPYDNGILIEIQLEILPFNQPVKAKIGLSTVKQTATIIV